MPFCPHGGSSINELGVSMLHEQFPTYQFMRGNVGDALNGELDVPRDIRFVQLTEVFELSISKFHSGLSFASP